MRFALAPRLVKQLNSSQKPRPTSFLSCNYSANLLLHMDPYGTYHNRFEAEGQFERLETGLKMIVMTISLIQMVPTKAGSLRLLVLVNVASEFVLDSVD